MRMLEVTSYGLVLNLLLFQLVVGQGETTWRVPCEYHAVTRTYLELCGCLKQIEAETKWRPFSIRYFQIDAISLNENVSIQISLKFVPEAPINN